MGVIACIAQVGTGLNKEQKSIVLREIAKRQLKNKSQEDSFKEILNSAINVHSAGVTIERKKDYLSVSYLGKKIANVDNIQEANEELKSINIGNAT